MNTSSKTNPDYMVLLNEDNALPQDFESTVEIISVMPSVKPTQLKKRLTRHLGFYGMTL